MVGPVEVVKEIYKYEPSEGIIWWFLRSTGYWLMLAILTPLTLFTLVWLVQSIFSTGDDPSIPPVPAAFILFLVSFFLTLGWISIFEVQYKEAKKKLESVNR